jgi:hypothetical protein
MHAARVPGVLRLKKDKKEVIFVWIFLTAIK